MSNNRVAELDGEAKAHERNGHTNVYRPNAHARLNGATATAEPPSATAVNGAKADQSTTGRVANGRFAPGNKFSRGNPFYRRQAALRQALLEEVGEDGLRKLARKLLEQALAGDVAAARTLLAYAVGKPTAAVNPDEADLDEARLIRERPSRGEVVLALLDSLPAEAVAELMRRVDAAQGDDPVAAALLSYGERGRAAVFAAEREAKRRRRQS
jgi:hypothetical protein